MRLGGRFGELQCYHSERRAVCCSAATRSRKKGLTWSPYVEADSDSASTSASSRSLADYGANMTLQRLERAYGNRHGHSREYLWVPNVFSVALEEKPQRTKNQDRTPDYFANVGDAIRTLRDDIPLLFEKDLNYGIYRDDIMFKDPRNSFQGMKNYKLMFWSLRFHGAIFFRKLYVEVRRIWQPEDGVIKMRWTVHGIPRVPWEAEGTFDGISTYKLDQSGKIYEHMVDNVLLRDPPMVTNPLLAGLNLAPMGAAENQTPQLGSWFTEEAEQHAAHQQPSAAEPPRQQTTWLASVTFSWVRLYAVLQGTVHLAAVSQSMQSQRPTLAADV